MIVYMLVYIGIYIKIIRISIYAEWCATYICDAICSLCGQSPTDCMKGNCDAWICLASPAMSCLLEVVGWFRDYEKNWWFYLPLNGPNRAIGMMCMCMCLSGQ